MAMPQMLFLATLALPCFVFLGVVAVEAISVGRQPATKAVEKRRARDLKTRPQVRKTFPPEAELRSLARSVIKRQVHPLIILPDGTILDGECRWRGLMLENPEFELEVIVVDRELSPVEVCEMQMISAMHSTSLSPYEQALASKEWLEKNPGATAKHLAEKIDLDASMLSRLGSLWKTIPAVIKAAEEGKIGPKAWHQISMVQEADQAGLLEMYLSGMPVAQIAEITRKARNNNRTRENPGNTVRTARVKCLMPSGMVITLAAEGDGMTMDDMEENVAILLKEIRKSKDQGLDSKTFSAVMRDKAKAS